MGVCSQWTTMVGRGHRVWKSCLNVDCYIRGAFFFLFFCFSRFHFHFLLVIFFSSKTTTVQDMKQMGSVIEHLSSYWIDSLILLFNLKHSQLSGPSVYVLILRSKTLLCARKLTSKEKNDVTWNFFPIKNFAALPPVWDVFMWLWPSECGLYAGQGWL